MTLITLVVCLWITEIHLFSMNIYHVILSRIICMIVSVIEQQSGKVNLFLSHGKVRVSCD